jgi:PAS domain-containing protein
VLAAGGLTDKEIARRLGLSRRTVGTYWERMREKLGRHSRTQLVHRLVRAGVDEESGVYPERLETCETSLNFLSEHSSDLIARFDSDLNCLEVNPSLAQIAPDREFVGRNIRELSDLFQPTRAWVRFMNAALRHARQVSFLCRFKGITPELRTSVLPVRGDGPGPTSVISITTVGEAKRLLAS